MRKTSLLLPALGLAALTWAPPSFAEHKADTRLSTRHDFVDMIHTTPMIVRGRVEADAKATGPVARVHVDRWLKGEGAAEIQVAFGTQHPVTPEGNGELFFLVPDRGDGGEPLLRCIQESSERWEIPDGVTGAVDQAVLDVLAGGPLPAILGIFCRTSPRLADDAANRLGLLATVDAKALEVATGVVADPTADPHARVALLGMLASRLPQDAVAVAADAADVQVPVRTAALDALARSALNEPSRRPRALSILESAAQEKDVGIEIAAAAGLAGLGRAEALPGIDAALATKAAELRQDALSALAALAQGGNAQAVDRLEKLEGDADPQIAARARAVLAQVGSDLSPHGRYLLDKRVLFGLVAMTLVAAGLIALRRRR